jgi:hypothetical protein
MSEEPTTFATRPFTTWELDLRDEVAARLFVRMHDNPETTYAEDAEDALIAANAFIVARKKWTR